MGNGDVKIECAACKRRYAWKPELAGKRVKCKCGEPIQVPTEPVPEIEEAPPDFGSLEFELAAAQTASETKAEPPALVARAATSRPRPKPVATPVQSSAAPVKVKLSDRWWFLLGMGVFMFPMAFYEFSHLNDLETHGGSVYVGQYEYLMYKIAGKWGVLIFFLLVSGTCTTFGVLSFLKRRREK